MCELHLPRQRILLITDFSVSMIGRADIEGSKSNVAMNAWLPQASYPCGNFILSKAARKSINVRTASSPFGRIEPERQRKSHSTCGLGSAVATTGLDTLTGLWEIWSPRTAKATVKKSVNYARYCHVDLEQVPLSIFRLCTNKMVVSIVHEKRSGGLLLQGPIVYLEPNWLRWYTLLLHYAGA